MSKKKYEVTADTGYIHGHLRSGHYEGYLTEEQYQEYLAITDSKERRQYISELCTLIVDDWEVDDYELPYNIKIQEIQYV